jgi:hypothetical protein
MKHWDNEEVDLLRAFINSGMSYEEIALELDRSWNSVRDKCRREGTTSNVQTTLLGTTAKYKQALAKVNPYLEVLEEYTNSLTAIDHKCLNCGLISKSLPKSKLRGLGCVGCCNRNNGSGIRGTKGIFYVVYFPKLYLYKFGITARSVKERMKGLGKQNKYTLILELSNKSTTSIESLEKEVKLSLAEQLCNTGNLVDGNTETFKTNNISTIVEDINMLAKKLLI